MSAPHADGTRGVVREGLRRLVRRTGPPPALEAPTAERTAWRNRLLDEVGGDARPFVELLLRVHAHGVAEAIPRGPLAPAAWGPLRARLAFGYAAETFADADAARWAVDAWAYALGAIDAGGLYVALPVALSYPRSPTAGAFTAIPSVSPAPPGSRGAARLAPPPAKLTGRVRRAVARANAPPAPNPFPANFDTIVGYTFAGMVTVAAVGMWIGITDRREAGGLEVSPAVSAGAGAAPSLPPRGDPVGPVPSAPAIAPAIAPPARVAVGSAALVDSLWLRDGTVRTGWVERLTATAVVLRDPWSNAAARVDLQDVAELHPRPGAVLPVGEAGDDEAGNDEAGDDEARDAAAPGVDSVAAGAPLGAGDLGYAAHAARAAGLAGRYAVRRRVLDVQGSESCDAVARAVRAAPATVETVAHHPGAGDFALTSRPGLHGTVDDNGRFRTALVEGARSGVRYRFRMVGQFGGDGFRAETESETSAVLRWGDVQQCRVSVALEARRLP